MKIIYNTNCNNKIPILVICNTNGIIIYYIEVIFCIIFIAQFISDYYF